MIPRRLKLLSSLLLVAPIAACSSGDSDDNTAARVLEIVLGDGTISRGEETALDLNFTFATESVFDDGRDVIIAIKLPEGISYVSGSGHVDSIGKDDDVAPRRFTCASDGGELVVFDLDEQDLTNAADPGGEADAKLQLDIEALLAGVGTGTIEARAGYDLNFTGCDSSFFGEELALITVFP